MDPSLLSALMFPALFALIFLGIPVAFALISVAFVFGFVAFGDTIGQVLYGRTMGVAGSSVLAAIPLFIFMGSMLERTSIARRLFETMQMWLGRMPGGLAVATITMCGIFAAATGIIGAVETVIGMMAIPPMLKHGYDKGLISGTICAGGSLGTIIPPSVTVIIYASIAELSIGDLFVGIIIPGLLMVLFFVGYILILGVLRPEQAPKLPREMVSVPLSEKLRVTATGLLPATVLIGAVLGSIIFGIASPTEAAAVGAGGALALSLAYREFSWSVLYQVVRKSVSISAMVMLIVVGGGMFSGVFLVNGGRDLVAGAVDTLNLPPAGLVAVFLFIVFLFGFVLDWITIVLIALPIFLAPLKAAGVDQVWFAVLMIVVIQTSYMTPPMAPAIFYLRSIAPKEITYGHMYRGVLPFVVAELLVLGVVALFPATATYLPTVLLGF
ncbi:MAG: TRAP transporter large permease subunit [Alphaproteobacteria bacterium]